MRIWSQVTSLGLAVIGFAIALLPRNYTEAHTGTDALRLMMWPKLVKFPIFWIGLALLGYIVLQALNPAWEYQTNGKAWWMHRIDHKTWLPTGIIAPFEKWNQWRTLVVYSSAWLTVCAIWVGLTRRRSIHALLITLAVNGLGVAAFGIAQRLAGNGLMFWFFRSPNDSFFASFIYKNHAGAYLNLILAVTCGLAGWYHSRARRRMERSNPSVVLVFFAMVISVSMVTSYARGATIVMAGFLSICIVAFAIHQFTAPKERRTPIIGITLILTFGFFLMTGLEAFKTREAWTRLKSGITREDRSLELRVRVTAASLEMLGENWKTGVGAGSYRFTFPVYQYRHPELISGDGHEMFWEHAHNDIVEIPAELGATGLLLILTSSLYFVSILIRNRFWRNPLAAPTALGLILAAVYAWWDFPFQCPAFLITWCSLWSSVTKLPRFEESKADATSQLADAQTSADR
jgi:hypothetical protein